MILPSGIELRITPIDDFNCEVSYCGLGVAGALKVKQEALSDVALLDDVITTQIQRIMKPKRLVTTASGLPLMTVVVGKGSQQDYLAEHERMTTGD